MKLILIDGAIAGTTTDDDLNGHTMVDAPDGCTADTVGEYTWDGVQVVHDPLAATTRAKANRISQIKSDATKQIEALAWRIERAQERELLGVAGEKVSEVLLEREAIRRASSRTEAEVTAAMDVASVNAVAFTVTPSDYANPERISRIEFLNRFTGTEMEGIVSAAKNAPALESYLMKLQSAEGVVLTDPVTMGGVQALEMMGLIGAGRATQILAI